jgi:hypothetical protein
MKDSDDSHVIITIHKSEEGALKDCKQFEENCKKLGYDNRKYYIVTIDTDYESEKLFDTYDLGGACYTDDENLFIEPSIDW